MSEALVSTILKAVSVGIPKQGRYLTWVLISLTSEVWTSVKEEDCFATCQTGVCNTSSNLCRSQ